ncbi:MAG: SPOR domain-containing protein [Myxococcota bacterium]
MRDARRIHERLEVRLDRPQVIWLTLGVIVLLAVSFALGMVAGRRAERLAQANERAEQPDRIAEIDGASDEHDKLTFYKELKEETLTAPVHAPAPARIAPAPVVKKTEAPKKPKLLPRKKPREVTRQASSKNSGAVREKLAGGPADSGQYTVQVSAFQSMDEAEAFAASLERKGFSPFITQASLPKKGTWYRVRMGAFDNELEATLAKQMLAQKDIPAWVLKSDR